MRVLVDGGLTLAQHGREPAHADDAPSVHVWMPGGHGTITGSEVTWRTPHAPFTAYADRYRDHDVVLPPSLAGALSVIEDVIDAAPLDGMRAVVVHGREALRLSVVDADGRSAASFELRARGTALDAFDASPDDDALVASHDDRFVASAPRGVRVTAVGDRVAIASAASGHVASWSMSQHAFEAVFRIATTESDLSWAIPIAAGLLVAARFRERWSELRCIGANGEVLGAWPAVEDDAESWGMCAPVVLGDFVVVCTDFGKAHVLALPALEEVHATSLPAPARDAHGQGSRFACLSPDHVMLGRLDRGRLALEEVLTPLQLIERGGARARHARSFPGVEQRALTTRLDAVFPTEPMVLVGTDGSIMMDDGTPLAPGRASSDLFRSRAVLLDARETRAVLSSTDSTWVVDLATHAPTVLAPGASARAHVLSRGVWLAREQAPARAAGLAGAGLFDPLLAAPERVVTYVPDVGSPVVLRRSCARSDRARDASADGRVVWSERIEGEERTRIFRFVESSTEAPEERVVDAHLCALAVDGESIFAIAGEYAATIVEVAADGTTMPRSDVVLEWGSVVASFVVVGGHAYWITPYAPDRPSKVLALELGSGDAPRVVYEASFGALTSLRVERSRLWWLESHTHHAEANGVHVLEPRALVASMRSTALERHG